MRAYLAKTLAGRRHAWAHLAIRHNSVARLSPCRLCEGAAQPAVGPCIFWDSDPLCDSCAAQVAPELSTYLIALRVIQRRGGRDRPGK